MPEYNDGCLDYNTIEDYYSEIESLYSLFLGDEIEKSFIIGINDMSTRKDC